MRLVSYEHVGKVRTGAFIDDDRSILDFLAAHDATASDEIPVALGDMLALIEGGDEALARARELVAARPASAIVEASEVKLRAPLQPPPQIRDCSCFELHLRNCYDVARRFKVRNEPDPESAYLAADRSDEDRVIGTFLKQPIYYKGNRFSVVGSGTDVVWPSYSKVLDFELELACYIGRRTKDAAAADAAQSIFGYSIYNDFSARDAQLRESGGGLGPAKGKDFDTGNVLGPCLVTADEIPDPQSLTMIASVNGEEWGRGSTRDMHWTFPQVIAHISQSETLYPGEILGSGTVGTGCGMEQLRYLKPGDVVELEIERIGVLRNRVVQP
ncbi:fumarylacetoacetate hydrolase family protein [Sphingobium naphthae]|uniref:Fumarylacetoacetate hydrolase family protein n=1 Tax=Sphingobium naphthae TaxID=1886786 RepID=A0ABU4A172_9SPHN|nr:fumarylacetoacetate hydrolase family protein [Sphingobium naphthae]MCC4250848.1 fumarylacetoacetate hydrolase family protein [Sphingobium naphthae]MDV5825490.1 fumarylacetoacetate hydrolase family protein [Sphingobium naphthae]